jgi:HlyD family secretion protein
VNAVRLSCSAISVAVLVSGCAKEEVVSVYQPVAVVTRDISVSVQAAGAILPDTVVEVKSKASGEILEFRVQTGDLVQRGTLLARIDRRVPQNRYNQAEAQLEVVNARLRNAEAQHRRSQELYTAKAITEQEFEGASLDLANARASLISAEVELETAKIALDDTEVRAPITGTIIAKNVERGAVISSPTSDVGGGTVLMRMADLSLVQVKTYVDETDIGKLKPGMAAKVDVEAFPNRPFSGTLLKIEPQGDTIQSVTMFAVLVRIPNADALLMPGMNAEVNIAVASEQGVLAVPNAALRTERDVASAAMVLGISDEDLQVMLEEARKPTTPASGDTTAKGGPLSEAAPAPTREQMMAVFQKQQSGATLTPDEQKIMAAAMAARGGGRGGRGGGGQSSQDAMFGGKYVVFALRNGKPTPVYVQTGITDLDYSMVRSGLTDQDSVLLLPSASMLESQQQLQQRMSRMGGGLPGQSR